MIHLVRNSFDLVEGDGIVATIVETGRTRRLMPGHMLRHFELATVLQTSNVNVVVGFASNAPKTVAVSISGYKIPGMFINQATMTNKPSLEMPFLGHYLP